MSKKRLFGAMMMKLKMRIAVRKTGASFFIRSSRKVKNTLIAASSYMLPNFEEQAKELMHRFIVKALDRN